VKDESQLPTGSFKARGQAVAITMARKFGIGRVAIPTNGNAGGALAAYAARAGMEAYVFMPEDTPGPIKSLARQDRLAASFYALSRIALHGGIVGTTVFDCRTSRETSV